MENFRTGVPGQHILFFYLKYNVNAGQKTGVTCTFLEGRGAKKSVGSPLPQ